MAVQRVEPACKASHDPRHPRVHVVAGRFTPSEVRPRHTSTLFRAKGRGAKPRVSHSSHPHQKGWGQSCTVSPPNVPPHSASPSSALGHGGSRCWSAYCSGYGTLHVRSTYGRSTLFSQVSGESGEPVSQAGWP